jgi:hypothetical protein
MIQVELMDKIDRSKWIGIAILCVSFLIVLIGIFFASSMAISGFSNYRSVLVNHEEYDGKIVKVFRLKRSLEARVSVSFRIGSIPHDETLTYNGIALLFSKVKANDSITVFIDGENRARMLIKELLYATIISDVFFLFLDIIGVFFLVIIVFGLTRSTVWKELREGQSSRRTP